VIFQQVEKDLKGLMAQKMFDALAGDTGAKDIDINFVNSIADGVNWCNQVAMIDRGPQKN
jgi:hypothetical protein